MRNDRQPTLFGRKGKKEKRKDSPFAFCLSAQRETCVVTEPGSTVQFLRGHPHRRGPGMRVGIGHDTHRLTEGRPLILGGVRIEHHRGLLGHSDADVVLHAVTDALLGAAGLGDIGDAYPDTDPAWHNADSALFLEGCRGPAAATRLATVVNVDVIIFAQEPKLGPVKQAIRTNLARLLSLESRRRQRQGQDRRARRPHRPRRGHRLPGRGPDRSSSRRDPRGPVKKESHGPAARLQHADPSERRVQDRPARQGHACTSAGPTVYKPSHIGHMVGPVIFDTVKRYLTYLGYKVTWVVNITDVDDKLIVARQEAEHHGQGTGRAHDGRLHRLPQAPERDRHRPHAARDRAHRRHDRRSCTG